MQVRVLPGSHVLDTSVSACEVPAQGSMQHGMVHGLAWPGTALIPGRWHVGQHSLGRAMPPGHTGLDAISVRAELCSVCGVTRHPGDTIVGSDPAPNLPVQLQCGLRCLTCTNMTSTAAGGTHLPDLKGGRPPCKQARGNSSHQPCALIGGCHQCGHGSHQRAWVSCVMLLPDVV